MSGMIKRTSQYVACADMFDNRVRRGDHVITPAGRYLHEHIVIAVTRSGVTARRIDDPNGEVRPDEHFNSDQFVLVREFTPRRVYAKSRPS